jgi:hypothetical protein
MLYIMKSKSWLKKNLKIILEVHNVRSVRATKIIDNSKVILYVY